MIINPNLVYLLILALVVAIIVIISLYTLHLKDIKQIKNAEEYFTRKTIPATVILHNAVLEAYEAACKKESKFEIEAYGKLLREIQGKW